MKSDLESNLPSGFLFSQSSLQDYTDCPRRFQLRYLEQLSWPAVESEPILENERRQLEGQLFHRLVQQHHIGLPLDKLSRLANSPNLQRWWENYQGYDFKIDGYAQFAELTLSTPLEIHHQDQSNNLKQDNRLLAKYDLIAITPGEKAIIFDWKTYRKRPRDEWMAARLQTRLYRVLLVRAGNGLNGGTPILPKQVEMIYWYADFPSEPAHFLYSVAQCDKDWDFLLGLVSEITSAQAYPMTADEKKCAYCPYRSYCERGTRAGEAEELEIEMSVPEIDFEQIQEIVF